MRSPEGDRALKKYERPDPLPDGVTMGFTVMVPGSELRATSVVPVDAKEVHWLPAPGDGRVAQVTIVFAPSATPADQWPAKDRGSLLIHRFDLPDEAALVIYHERDETADERERWEMHRLDGARVLDALGEGKPGSPDEAAVPTEYGILVEGRMTHGGPYYLVINVR
jgi:hypothetical protein